MSVLDEQPRVSLGHLPTALERCERLGAELGVRLWVKRDDCTGLAVGGNKTRKLEYLLGAAVTEGAHGVVTFGALQSNHARQTAAACARTGLGCDLVLTRAVERDDIHYTRSGNLLLDGVLGATLHVVDDPDEAFVRFAELFDAAEREGRSLYGIGPGGSDPVGTLGYVRAGVELAEQLRAEGAEPRRVVVAASTTGTAAGLVLGLQLARFDTVVDVACVYEPAAATSVALSALIDATAQRFGLPLPDTDAWTLSDSCLGDGYGAPTAAALDAIELFAHREGILLDPVYTSKAAAHLLSTLTADEEVVFVHTGGSPGLFAYTDQLTRR